MEEKDSIKILLMNNKGGPMKLKMSLFEESVLVEIGDKFVLVDLTKFVAAALALQEIWAVTQ